MVTYNRLSHLAVCLNGLFSQTRLPDEIIVIDNGSTDGTAEWLQAKRNLYIMTQSNVGGAGGFATGLEVAFSRGHEWVWCMDDDCLPCRTSLEALELVSKKIGDKYPVINSNVIKDGITPKENVETIEPDDLFAVKGANFFNGTLIGRKAFGEVGNINRDLIIWGDEVNFHMRCRKRYKLVPVAITSYMLHPPPIAFPDIPDWKKYFAVRNAIYNGLRFSRLGPIGVFWALSLRVLEVLTGKLGWRVFCLGVWAGICGKLGWSNPFFQKDDV